MIESMTLTTGLRESIVRNRGFFEWETEDSQLPCRYCKGEIKTGEVIVRRRRPGRSRTQYYHKRCAREVGVSVDSANELKKKKQNLHDNRHRHYLKYLLRVHS